MSRLYVYGLVSGKNIYAFAVSFQGSSRRASLSAYIKKALTKAQPLIRVGVFFICFSLDSRLLVDCQSGIGVEIAACTDAREILVIPLRAHHRLRPARARW